NQAKAAAQKAGINVDSYDHVSMIGNYPCTFGGMGEQPGRITWANWLDQGLFQHELGHNLGLWHAGGLACPENGQTVPMSSSCTNEEYGDPFDSMGHADLRHEYQANYKAMLGWIPSSNIVTATTDQALTLTPMNQSSGKPQLLRIQGANDVMY